MNRSVERTRIATGSYRETQMASSVARFIPSRPFAGGLVCCGKREKGGGGWIGMAAVVGCCLTRFKDFRHPVLLRRVLI